MKYKLKYLNSDKEKTFCSLEQFVKWAKKEGIPADEFNSSHWLYLGNEEVDPWEYLDIKIFSKKELAALEEMAYDRAFEYFEEDREELFEHIKENLKTDKSVVWKKL